MGKREEGRREPPRGMGEEKEIAKWKVAGHRYRRGQKRAASRRTICKRCFKTGYLLLRAVVGIISVLLFSQYAAAARPTGRAIH